MEIFENIVLLPAAVKDSQQSLKTFDLYPAFPEDFGGGDEQPPLVAVHPGTDGACEFPVEGMQFGAECGSPAGGRPPEGEVEAVVSLSHVRRKPGLVVADQMEQLP